ncbi:MAG: hypothetical protein JWP81_1159 [Ferruginibacter sp.]|nr:hypothetical protein [Ferruginibacter sp.]
MKFFQFRLVFLWAGCFLLFSPNDMVAQDAAESDSSFYRQAMANAIALYHQSFGNQSALYNGGKYSGYPFRMQEGFPFFYSPQPATGSVIYDGISYDSILMHYDEVADAVIINNQADWLQLLDKRVSRFNLFDADFIRIEKDSAHSNLVSSGFYNRLYHGKTTSLLKKQIKSIIEVISINLELQHFVDTKDLYYLQKEDQFFPINRRKDFLRSLGNRKKEVQQFIKANKLNFRRDKENMLTKATAYYDSLNK